MRVSAIVSDVCSRLPRSIPLRMLDRYVIKQFLFSYLVCSTSIVGLFVVLEGLSRLGKFLEQDRNLLIVMFHYFAATIPVYFSQYLAPVLTLIAAMFGITLLNKGRELVPMRAAGISVPRILAPCFLMAIFFAMVQIGIQEFVLPLSKDYIRVSTAYGKKKGTIRPGLMNDPDRNLLISVAEYLPHQRRGTKVQITERYPSSAVKTIYESWDIVWIETDEQWELRDGKINAWLPDGRPKIFDGVGEEAFAQRFEALRINTKIRPVDLESSDRDIPYLSYGELLNQYRRRSHLHHLEVKLHQRFAFPLANVILLLLGLPFVIRDANRSVIVGVLVAMGISAAYMLSTTVCADLGNKGDLPPAVAAWLPVLFFGALGFTIFDGMDS